MVRASRYDGVGGPDSVAGDIVSENKAFLCL